MKFRSTSVKLRKEVQLKKPLQSQLKPLFSVKNAPIPSSTNNENRLAPSNMLDNKLLFDNKPSQEKEILQEVLKSQKLQTRTKIQSEIQPSIKATSPSSSPPSSSSTCCEKSLLIRFKRDERGFRHVLRDKFAIEKYTHIEIQFDDEKLDKADCLLFSSQGESLRQLTLRFEGFRPFDIDNLDMLKCVKLPHLELLVLVFKNTSRNRHEINYSLFWMTHFPRIEIRFGEQFRIIYKRDDEEVLPIDFSRMKITQGDFEDFSKQVKIFSPTALSLDFTANSSLSTQNKKFISSFGRILSRLEVLHINFKNCSLEEEHSKAFLEGLKGEESKPPLRILSINMEGNQALKESVFKIFEGFKSLTTLTFVFDKQSQIIQQYSDQLIYRFLSHLRHLSEVKFITNSNQIIYHHNLHHQTCFFSINSLNVSPFQLTDACRAINYHKKAFENISLELGSCHKIEYSTIIKFIGQLVSADTPIKVLSVNLTNSNLTEMECVGIYLALVNTTKQLNLLLDIQLTDFLRISPSPPPSSFPPPPPPPPSPSSPSTLFLHLLGERITNSDLFVKKCSHIFSSLCSSLYNFQTATVSFSQNSLLSADVFEEYFHPFIHHHRNLSSLTLDFSSCSLSLQQMTIISLGILSVIKDPKNESSLLSLRLSFLHNEETQLCNIRNIFGKFLSELPQITELVIATDLCVLKKSTVPNLSSQSSILYVSPFSLYSVKPLPKLTLNALPQSSKRIIHQAPSLLESSLIKAAVVTFSQDVPLFKLEDSIKELALNHPYELVFILSADEKLAHHLEILHADTLILKHGCLISDVSPINLSCEQQTLQQKQ